MKFFLLVCAAAFGLALAYSLPFIFNQTITKPYIIELMLSADSYLIKELIIFLHDISYILFIYFLICYACTRSKKINIYHLLLIQAPVAFVSCIFIYTFFNNTSFLNDIYTNSFLVLYNFLVAFGLLPLFWLVKFTLKKNSTY